MNCGRRRGSSVREEIKAIGRVVGHQLSAGKAPRRAGDPPSLAAGTSLIRKTLCRRPVHGDADKIVTHALAWERKLNGL